MKKWLGAAGICINDKSELLMVLEGGRDGAEKWSVPTGGLEAGETFEDCVIREVREETGYTVEIIDKLQVKSGEYKDIQIAYEVHYFLVKIVGGKAQIQDPDQLVRAIDWKTRAGLIDLELTYPEDRRCLLDIQKEIQI